jgi:F-type H+-transporting ATPase subunit c
MRKIFHSPLANFFSNVLPDTGATAAVGRNPDAQGKVLLTMMVGLAMIESLAIYALVISLVILYANPLLKMIQ